MNSCISRGHPIAIMSFDRPHYLKQVLESLKAQVPSVQPNDVFLFQDGYQTNNIEATDPNLIQECIAQFRQSFPEGTVITDDRNIGVALNFNRAEEHFFLHGNRDAAIFLEDDLVLSPFYIEVVTRLLQIALKNERIAYVAAYGDHRASVEEQQKSQSRLILMRHKWGFGLTRRQWLMQRSILEPYLAIVSRTEYVSRDNEAIANYYRKLGFGSTGTSQDAMKDVASAILGTIKIMTYACFGKNIGEVGVHSRSDFYRAEGFGSTQLFPARIDQFDELTDSVIEDFVQEIQRAAREALI